MTLTQLGAFVLVARLGSVAEAARTLGVSEPAVSQALSALRRHLDDPLIVRGPDGMTLTEGGARLLPVASQMVVLGSEAERAVRAARGAPETLRVVATAAITEFAATPLMEAFTRRHPHPVEGGAGVVASLEIPALLHHRLADVALGPSLGDEPGLVSEPVFRTRLVAVGSARDGAGRRKGTGAPPVWLVDPSGTDPGSETSALLARLKVPEERVRVYPTQTAAWEAAADGAGLAVALAHLVAPRVQRGELRVVATRATPVEIAWHVTTLAADRRPRLAGTFRRFLATPDALHIMRSPGAGVPPSRFRPPVHVTIWS
jgi:DNA-binding transcriptional LysR family regulator